MGAKQKNKTHLSKTNKKQTKRAKQNNLRSARSVLCDRIRKMTNVDNYAHKDKHTENSDSVRKQVRQRTNDSVNSVKKRSHVDILISESNNFIGEYLKPRVRRPSALFIPDAEPVLEAPVLPDVDHDLDYFSLLHDDVSEEQIAQHDRLLMTVNTNWENISGELYILFQIIIYIFYCFNK